MIDRILVLLLLVGVVAVVTLLVRRSTERRVRTALESQIPAGLADRLPLSEPAIIYFHGSHCGACRQQAAVLETLSRDITVAVVPIDAADEAMVSRAFGVMTVPATVVIDRSRRVRAVNLGFRAGAELAAQLRSLSPAV